MPEPPQLTSGPEPHLLDKPREEKLLEEIQDLRQQLEQERNQHKKEEPKPIDRRKLWLFVILGVLAIVVIFLIGFIPHLLHEREVKKESAEKEKMLPVITYVAVKHSPAMTQLELPGTMEAITEAPLLARADGYLGKRYADIGDRVKAGQLLAEIEAPDLDQQVRQAESQLEQLRAALRQSLANLEQAKANQSLAKVTAERYAGLLVRGAVSRQENDQQQTAYQAQTANVGALEQAVSAAQQNIAAGQANLARLRELQGFEKVRAPFTGVITLRNVDTGALISTGNTLLFRIAETDRLRTYIYVPETNAGTVQTGQTATLHVMEYPGRQFQGVITRTASSMDPTTRTMLTEVQVANPSGILLPGTYAQVSLNNERRDPPIMIPGDALIVRSEGTFVGLLQNEEPPKKPLPPGGESNASHQNGSSGGGKQGDQKGGGKAGGKDQGDKQVGTKQDSKQDKQQDGKQQDKGSQQGKGKESPKKELQQEEEQQEELPTFTVHLVPVNIGRDYGNDMEIVSGLKDGDRVVSNPNDAVQEKAKVKGMLSKQPVGAESAAAGSSNTNVNTQKTVQQPNGEPTPKKPAQERSNRGPGF